MYQLLQNLWNSWKEVQLGEAVFSYFPAQRFSQCLNLNESHQIYAYKHYGYKTNAPIFLAKANHSGS